MSYEDIVAARKMWRMGYNTMTIAQELLFNEHEIYNRIDAIAHAPTPPAITAENWAQP